MKVFGIILNLIRLVSLVSLILVIISNGLTITKDLSSYHLAKSGGESEYPSLHSTVTRTVTVTATQTVTQARRALITDVPLVARASPAMVAAAAATTASPSVLQNETTEATYYRNSTIPIQVGGVLWSVFNRILIMLLGMLLIFAEIDFFNLIPKKVLFDETHGVGLIGFLQVLMSANVLSHFSRSFAQVAAWMCCVVGCINMCFGLIQMVTGRRFNIKDHRPGFIKPRDGGKGECTSESYDDNYDRDGSITAAEREETSSPAKPRFVAPIPPPLPPRPVEDDGFESYDMQQMPPRAHADHSAQTSQRRRNEPPQLPPIDTDFVQHSPPPRALHGEPPTSTRMLSRSRPRVNRQDDLWRDRFNGD